MKDATKFGKIGKILEKINPYRIMNNDKKFNLEHQFDLYLERINLKGKKLAVNQYREMKQAFIGACGQLLILLRDDVGALEDDEAFAVMDDMINQVGNFFIKASSRQN